MKSDFLSYQAAWLRDQSRFKIGLWARQTGKDYTCAAEAVFDCLATPRTHWLILACGERQARETLEKARELTTTLSTNDGANLPASRPLNGGANLPVSRPLTGGANLLVSPNSFHGVTPHSTIHIPSFHRPLHKSLIKRESSTEIRFTNGSRITALPARKETIRGYSANLILTEFAFHEDP
jgi:hypothetical protein